MSFNRYSSEESLSFRGIVLNYVKKIIELNLRVIEGDGVKHTKTYRDSILGLSDVLLPFYDKDMTDSYSKFEKEYNEILEEEITKESTKKIMRICRELFRNLNLLLKRNDYLKSSVYGEERDEIAVDEEEEWVMQ